MKGMIGSVTAELLVLRKRASTWTLFGLWVTLAMFFTYLLPYVTYRGNAGGPMQTVPPELLPESLVGSLSGGFPFFGGVIAIILGVLAVGSDYGWGTLKTLFTQRPGRLQVFGAKLLALGVVLIPFVLAVFVVGALCSYAIAWGEGAAVAWPSAWLLGRVFLAGWFILAAWMAFGVMLAVISRGTALAIGVGLLYAVAIEGLISAFFSQVDLLEPIVELFLRANAYSLVEPLGASTEAAADNGPGSFAGPYVDGTQAALVLAVWLAGFLLVSAVLLRRRDVT